MKLWQWLCWMCFWTAGWVLLWAMGVIGAEPIRIWTASSGYSYPARVMLRKSDDYQAILSGVPDSLVVDSVYWIESMGGNFVLRGSDGTPKVYPCSQYAIVRIDEIRSQ